jgi:iron complex transport system substrate-binding protein
VRVVSLLPSATEILFALGAGRDIVGVTYECDYPLEARSRRIVSTSSLPTGLNPREIDAEVRARLAAGEDLYHLDAGALSQLDPDLIVSQDLCAVCAVDVETVDAAISHLGCKATVLTIDPVRLEEVLDSIEVIGRAVGRPAQAALLVTELRRRLDRVNDEADGLLRPRVAVLEWTDPLFAAGHWMPDMVNAAGGICAVGESGHRSRTVSAAEVAEATPDVIVVAPCGFGLAESRRLALMLLERGELPSGVPVWAVDADAAFVRPGPRLVDGVETLANICHPSAFPARPEFSFLVGTTSTNPKTGDPDQPSFREVPALSSEMPARS